MAKRYKRNEPEVSPNQPALVPIIYEVDLADDPDEAAYYAIPPRARRLPEVNLNLPKAVTNKPAGDPNQTEADPRQPEVDLNQPGVSSKPIVEQKRRLYLVPTRTTRNYDSDLGLIRTLVRREIDCIFTQADLNGMSVRLLWDRLTKPSLGKGVVDMNNLLFFFNHTGNCTRSMNFFS